MNNKLKLNFITETGLTYSLLIPIVKPLEQISNNIKTVMNNIINLDIIQTNSGKITQIIDSIHIESEIQNIDL